jgi:DNA replication protein DnaC
MKKLTYQNYCDYYASKCSICESRKRILKNNIWTCCSCQYTATIKWRFEQIEIHPESLKYKNWADFTGEIKGTNKETGKLEILGHLSVPTFMGAKQKAMEYCFGSSDIKVLEDKKKYLSVHKHCMDGQNIVIAGRRNTGRTLLAVLVLKEVVNASCFFNLNLEFKWIKSSDLIDAARWDNSKSIDHVFLDSLYDIHFLVIDGVDIYRGGHNTPPDTISLNVLFNYRRKMAYPTIIICSDVFLNSILHAKYGDEVSRPWGEEFYSLITNPSNVTIEMEREEIVW